MLNINYSKIFIVSLLLFVATVAPFFVKSTTVKAHPDFINEIFDVRYSTVNSVNSAVKFVDHMYVNDYGNKFDTLKYINLISDFTKRRFYHGLSEYAISENWIANLLGKFVWSHFSAIVEPDDILKYSEGLCSQQTIVFIEILKRKGISYRTIGLGPKEGPGHFLAEVLYNGTWHLYDVDKEPRWERTLIAHQSIDYYKENPDTLYSVYNEIIDVKILSKMIKTVSYGKINEFPAVNMLLFHRTTKFLTYLLPAFFLCIIILSFFKKKEAQKKVLKIANYENLKEINII